LVNTTVRAVALLDFILILMTGVWIMVGIYRGLSNLDWWYNYIYVILNITTLILNLKVIRVER